MLPHDTPNEDWNLYFNDTYMRHIVRGPMYIQIRPSDEDGNATFHGYTVTKGGVLARRSTEVDPSQLRIFWPRPGAYNLPGGNKGAIFIGRQAQRHMKRSAFRDHYYITWNDELSGEVQGHPYSGAKMLPIMMNPVEYGTIARFRATDEETCRSIALSPKIIIHKVHGELLSLIYMSEEVGSIDRKNKFIPFIHMDSRTNRITEHLKTLGVRVA